MTYPGNPSLSAAVKDRVVSTFQQTLTLYKQGRTDEVAAGCNLILQMDPMFDPARKLMEKTRNPALPIDVDALLPVAAPDQRSPMQQAREAMAGRDFQRVIHITSAILTDDLLNDEARVLGDEAREKLEAAPFVEQFTRKCDQSLAAGNVAAAKMDLEKARALDAAHPEVLRIEKVLAARDAGPAPSAPSPSFVVDDRAHAAGGRSTAQAADFGFTFEEEKPAEVSFANFSFDTPAHTDFSFDAPPPAPEKTPASGEFDFATASVVTSDDDQKKIEQFLADGDRAFTSGDYQQAIDLWSRIFLIDVTNDQASERIERAKGKRREIEQKVEGIIASGIAAFDAGDTAKAHGDFTEALRIDPRNTTAQEYLDRLGETVKGGPAASPTPYIPPSPSDEKLDLGFFDDDLPLGGETPLIPPPPPSAVKTPAQAKSGKPKAAAPPKTGRKLPVGLIAAVLGIVIVVGGGWFVWNRMSSEPEVEATGAGEAIIARAGLLAKNGKYDQAIALLQDIKPGDPQHDRAMMMIADLQQKKSTSAQMIDGVPAGQYFDQRIAAAQSAFDAHDYSAAKAAYEQAMRVKPLPPEVKGQYDIAAQQASKLDAAKALFAERKYNDAIANLQQLLDQDPQNQSIRRMISAAHFNLAATALQEERTNDAIRELDEVLRENPSDELARRSRELAVRYNNEPKDLLYRIYVKYLPLRQAV